MSERRDPEPELKCPLWMMTFGDCMSLLVTFFVMLIAFSNMEEDQLMDMVGAMKGALGVTPSKSTGKIVMIENWEKIRGRSAEKHWLTIDELSAIIPTPDMTSKRFGSPKIGASSTDFVIKMLDEGIAFIINTDPLFEQGRSEIRQGNESLFDQIGTFAISLDNEIRIVSMMKSNSQVATQSVKTPLGLGIERAISLKNALCSINNIDRDRFGVGSQLLARYSTSGDSPDSNEHMMIIIVGRRDMEEMTPEQIIIQDKWD